MSLLTGRTGHIIVRMHRPSTRVNWIRFSYDAHWGGVRTTNFGSRRGGGFGRKQANVYNFSYLRSSPTRGIAMTAGPIRILCVEDHPVYREGLRTIIGCEPDMLLVGYAGNSAQAIAEFRRHQPDVTLMDLRLPGADGTDVLVTIRGE